MGYDGIVSALDTARVVQALFAVAAVIASFYVVKSGLRQVLQGLNEVPAVAVSNYDTDADGDELYGLYIHGDGSEWYATSGGMKPVEPTVVINPYFNPNYQFTDEDIEAMEKKAARGKD